jgi:hypothetical protein
LVTAASTGSAPAPTTAQVGSATAGLAAFDVGTYSVLVNASTSNVAAGSTIAGSSLRYSWTSNTTGLNAAPWNGGGGNSASYNGGGTAPSGTWRAMSYSQGRTGPNGKSYFFPSSFFLRIS